MDLEHTITPVSTIKAYGFNPNTSLTMDDCPGEHFDRLTLEERTSKVQEMRNNWAEALVSARKRASASKAAKEKPTGNPRVPRAKKPKELTSAQMKKLLALMDKMEPSK